MPIIIHPSTAGTGGKSVFTVNVEGTVNTSGGTADKTYSQILEAINREYAVQAKYGDYIYPMVASSSPFIIFQLSNATALLQIIFSDDGDIMILENDIIADADAEATAGRVADAKWVLDKFKVYEASLV